MFPRLLQLGNFYLPTYGVLVASGVLFGLWISVRNSEKQGINGDDAWNLGIFMVLAGIVGAKILYIINDWKSYAGDHWRDIFSLNTLQAGGVFSGGLIGALVVGAWYMRRHHMPLLRTTDAFSPGLAFGHVFGRFGCFSAGCCYGKATHHFWGVTFTNPLANSVSQTPLNIPLEPTQLIEAAAEFINFVFLMWLLKRKKFDGQVFATFIMLYGVERFFIEFLRGDEGRGVVFGGLMSGTQLISIGLVIAGGLIWWLKSGSTESVPASVPGQPALAGQKSRR
ncbi:MAG TPA: prolipoprotein diacylglyceryl transferase [Terriglobales bacterium]|nr:prolipoprotein diacylglyceryl transferase [Terriglobales bacterium]